MKPVLVPAVVVLVVGLVATAQAETVPRPPPFTADGGCELWEGKADEHDLQEPWVIRLRICPKGDGVEGAVQYDSAIAGYSIRAVHGAWHGPRLALQETGFLENRPAPGWTFCLMDSYDFERAEPDRLKGIGVSKACGDFDTRYSLQRVRAAQPPVAPAPPPSSSPPVAPAPPASSEPPAATSPWASASSVAPSMPSSAEQSAPEPSLARSGCGCVLAGRRAGGGLAGLAWLALGWFGVRRRRVRRAAARTVGVVAALGGVLAAQRAHAEMLPRQSPCALWFGSAREDDGEHEIRLRICASADGHVKGDMLYAIPSAGHSVRAVEGRWHGATLTMRETHFVENAPTAPWTFCLMDGYELALRARGRLAGRGWSDACHDPDTKFEMSRTPPPRSER